MKLIFLRFLCSGSPQELSAGAVRLWCSGRRWSELQEGRSPVPFGWQVKIIEKKLLRLHWIKILILFCACIPWLLCLGLDKLRHLCLLNTLFKNDIFYPPPPFPFYFGLSIFWYLTRKHVIKVLKDTNTCHICLNKFSIKSYIFTTVHMQACLYTGIEQHAHNHLTWYIHILVHPILSTKFWGFAGITCYLSNDSSIFWYLTWFVQGT